MGTFRSFLDSVLGSYTPVTYVYNSDSIIPDGFSGVDWPYLIRAFFLLVVVWCTLRVIGGLICR